MELTRKHIMDMVEFCKLKWGKSMYHKDFPRVRVYHSSNGKCGHFNYEKNILCVFISTHSNWVEVCDTVIHEYTHYLQDMEGMYETYMTKYYRSYDNHPYEITARNRGEKYKWECLKYIWRSE